MPTCSTLNVLVLVSGLLAAACGVAKGAALIGETRHIELPSATVAGGDQLRSEYRRPDTIPFPSANPYRPEKARLGRALFYDTRLSGSGALSCASCHNPSFGYGDGRAKSLGDRMNPLDRRSPSIINSAWGQTFMWDGRSGSLEEQVAGPIEGSTEMNQSLEKLIAALSGIAEYQPLFAAAFPRQSITFRTVAEAIATYERTIISADAPFDAWIEGDEAAISDSAKRGFALFNTKAGCASCHGGWNLTDDGFHDIGLPDRDIGRGRMLPQVVAMQHAFKTPSLRETTRRGPYMHDGSLATLSDVITHYNEGGISRASRSRLIKPLGLSPDEQADVLAFLNTLTGAVDPNPAPALPR
jgi:cytochrome c peroxidase